MAGVQGVPVTELVALANAGGGDEALQAAFAGDLTVTGTAI